MRHHSSLVHAVTTMFTNPSESRAVGECRRMRQAISDFAAARHQVANLGDDPLVEHLAAAAGFRSHDLAIRRLATSKGFFTIVVVPRRIWTDPVEMQSLRLMKAEAKVLRTRCLLAPHGSVAAPKRAVYSRLVARCRNIPVSGPERGKVLRHIRKVGSGTVASCATELQDHDDPYGAVLALLARGELQADRSEPLRPNTSVWLPRTPAATGDRP